MTTSQRTRTWIADRLPERTMRDLIAVGPAYPLVGPNQVTYRRPVAAPADVVFAALADVAAWREAAGIGVEWTSPEPYGVGATRTVSVAGGHVFEECFLVWEPGRRMVFRVERCSLPVRAFAESWGAEPTGGATCDLVWSSAFDWNGRAAPLMAPSFRAIFSANGRRAMRKMAALVESDPGRFTGGGT